MFMSDFPKVSAADYLETAIINSSNLAVSGKRSSERRANERRQSPTLSHERFEKAVDAALGEFIPPHEVYNDMRMAALEAVLDHQLYKADPVKDGARLESLAHAIQCQQPKFRNPGKESTVAPALIAGLYRQLKDIPQSALIGHRWDETKIDGNMTGSVRAHNKLETRRADSIIDAIMPASPYYNDLRQKFTDLVRAKGSAVTNWLQKEAKNREEIRKPGAPDFIKNEFFYYSKQTIEELDKLLLPYKKAFEADIPPAKPISPEALVRIGKLITAHHRSWVPTRLSPNSDQPVAKFPRLNLRHTTTNVPETVPSGIANASRHFQPDIAADRPKAISFSKRLVGQVDSILPPTASNFGKRLQLGRRIFAAREKILSASSVEQAYRAALGNPDAKKNEVTSQHQQTIRDMAETCERFVAAYEVRDPEFGVDAETAGPPAPVKRVDNKRPTANLNALKKAGANNNQLPITVFYKAAKRSYDELESQPDEPAKWPERPDSHAVSAPLLNQPGLLDTRSREDEHRQSR
jgi:hypothetical protein